tara:strand:+ start:556 stop:1098 length:543 start_codon:yes stop_codon:yes gene_type:complete
MSIQTENFDFDPFARAIPGQSFTDTPGKLPHEKQPEVVEPDKALEVVKKSLTDPVQLTSVVRLLDAGLSAETIASALVLKMFSEGVFTPDVAEIIKPPLVAHIVNLGTQANVEDMAVVNNIPKEQMSTDESFELMKTMNPDKYNRQMLDSMAQNKLDDITAQAPEIEQPQSESFLDMEIT